jgi:hypothetical protein
VSRCMRAVKLLCDSIEEDTCLYKLVQTHRMYSINAKPIWVITMCECKFISCNKPICPVEDVDNRGIYA